ncbi:MAG: hypothetical protein IKF37_02530 [Bacilli bacterium]|nr:hypothetical protein [Bacilli bacterium]
MKNFKRYIIFVALAFALFFVLTGNSSASKIESQTLLASNICSGINCGACGRNSCVWDECEWKNDKCSFKSSNTQGTSNTGTECSGKSEDACKKVVDQFGAKLCDWNNNKCSSKASAPGTSSSTTGSSSTSGSSSSSGENITILEGYSCQNSKFFPLFESAKFIIVVIQIAVPFGLVIWGSLDWFKALIAHDEKEMRMKRRPFISRVVAALIIMILPWFMQLLSNIIAGRSNSVNFWTCYSEAKARINFSKWREDNNGDSGNIIEGFGDQGTFEGESASGSSGGTSGSGAAGGSGGRRTTGGNTSGGNGNNTSTRDRQNETDNDSGSGSGSRTYSECYDYSGDESTCKSHGCEWTDIPGGSGVCGDKASQGNNTGSNSNDDSCAGKTDSGRDACLSARTSTGAVKCEWNYVNYHYECQDKTSWKTCKELYKDEKSCRSGTDDYGHQCDWKYVFNAQTSADDSYCKTK